MSAIRFLSVEMLFLFWTLPVLILAFAYAARRRRRTLREFADSAMVKKLNDTVSPTRRVWKAALIVLAYSAVIVALVRPAWNPKPQTVMRRGRDVVFVLDVSRSMLAEDLAPNRLEQAKYSILDAVSQLRGDRVGLVVFAGNSSVKCPLTLDYGFFRSMLERVSVDSVERGGTLIGDALRTTMDDVFTDQEKRFKDIVLITDGEDHDSFPVDAAAEAGSRGIRIIAIGLGDENAGRRIPITDESGRKTFLTHNGEEVWTRLDADSLREIANAAPGGRYINVATGAMDFGDIYLKLIADAEQRLIESQTVERYEEKFQIFIALAFAALLVQVALPERKRRRRRPADA